MSNFGFTKNGFLRGRFTDFYEKFRDCIRDSDAFKRTDADGNVVATDTTLENPDDFGGTPLVELATLYSGTNADIHEAFEAMAQNLDPRDASGKWLRSLFVLSGLTPPNGRSDAELRAILNSPSSSKVRSGKGGIEAAVASITGLSCSRTSSSTIRNPIEGIPTPGFAISVLANDIDSIKDEVAQAIWNNSGVGLFNLVGDTTGKAIDAEGNCHFIDFYNGCRILLGVELQVTIDACSQYTVADIPALLTTKFRETHKCSQSISPAQIVKLLCDFPDITIHNVKLGRRAPELMLLDDNGDFVDPVMVMLDDAVDPIPWAMEPFCDPCNGEIWCPLEEDCSVDLKFFEFFDMAEQLVEVTVGGVEPC